MIGNNHFVRLCLKRQVVFARVFRLAGERQTAFQTKPYVAACIVSLVVGIGSLICGCAEKSVPIQQAVFFDIDAKQAVVFPTDRKSVV